MRTLVKNAISSFGVEVQRTNRGRKVHVTEVLDLLRQDPSPQPEVKDFLRYAVMRAEQSRSQLFQDLFVLNTLDEKRNGYFVEFGAADGVYLSNSFLLEHDYN